jgi:hypothetical protein
MCDAPPPSSRKGSASRTFLPGAVFKPNSVLVLGGRKSAGGSSGNGGSAGGCVEEMVSSVIRPAVMGTPYWSMFSAEAHVRC